MPSIVSFQLSFIKLNNIRLQQFLPQSFPYFNISTICNNIACAPSFNNAWKIYQNRRFSSKLSVYIPNNPHRLSKTRNPRNLIPISSFYIRDVGVDWWSTAELSSVGVGILSRLLKIVYELARPPTLFTTAKGRNTDVCNGILDVIARFVRFVLSCPGTKKLRHSTERL